jgi:hypothetical protein
MIDGPRKSNKNLEDGEEGEEGEEGGKAGWFGRNDASPAKRDELSALTAQVGLGVTRPRIFDALFIFRRHVFSSFVIPFNRISFISLQSYALVIAVFQ